MMKQRLLILVSFVAFALSLHRSLNAAQIEGVQFKDAHKIAEQQLVLNSVALMRYQIVIKAMVAGLYLADGVKPQDALTDVPKRLEIHYFWDLQGKDIVTAANKVLSENLSKLQLEKHRKKIDEMNSLFEDVKAGDRYSLTYIPGKGTELSLNGKRKGIIEGADFASAYFTIWLGKKPMDVSMRDQLLKRRL